MPRGRKRKHDVVDEIDESAEFYSTEPARKPCKTKAKKSKDLRNYERGSFLSWQSKFMMHAIEKRQAALRVFSVSNPSAVYSSLDRRCSAPRCDNVSYTLSGMYPMVDDDNKATMQNSGSSSSLTRSQTHATNAAFYSGLVRRKIPMDDLVTDIRANICRECSRRGKVGDLCESLDQRRSGDEASRVNFTCLECQKNFHFA
jgi:RNase P subunit RPR2